MDAKTLLLEEIEREYDYLKKQEVGTEKYNASMSRLNTLLEKLGDLEEFEDEKKDRAIKNLIEGVKFVVGNVIVPVSLSLLILKSEETGTLTTALRGLVTGTATPKRMF